jgi:hypothetical protein
MEPLTPAGLDLREFGWMPLDVLRLRDSDLAVLASGDAFRAAVMLWCAAWHQVPAGSLPSDNRLLANLAGYGRDLDGWASVKADAMRGFVECADGRLYHPTVCEKAIEADDQRKRQRKRTEAATAARRNEKRDDNRNVDRDVAHKSINDDARNEVHLTLPDLTVPKSKKAAKPQPSSSEDFENFKRDYPRREGGYGWKAAERKYLALVKTGVDPKRIADALRRLTGEMRKLQRIGTQFVPMPQKWLNSEDFTEIAAMSFIEQPEELNWDAVLVAYKKTGHWSRFAGNDPSSPNCRCPPEILAKYGLLQQSETMQ